jgi:hypothetical protein
MADLRLNRPRDQGLFEKIGGYAVSLHDFPVPGEEAEIPGTRSDGGTLV